MISRRRCVLVLALLGGVATSGAYAQDFSKQPITIVVGASAGGSADTSARTIADALGARLGTQVVIENVPGAGGLTATARVARGQGDGHVLLMQQTGLATLPALYPKLQFDVARDLTAVGMVNISYSMIVGRRSLPVNDMQELAAWMRGPGAPAKFAHPGVGSFGHLTTLLFAKSLQAQVDLIPYRGISPAINDLVGEHVDLASGNAVLVLPLIKEGTLKPYAFSGTKRHPGAPGVPTFGEIGYPDLSRPFWHALFAPAKTPRPVLDRLNAALREALTDSRVVRAYGEMDLETLPAEQMSIEGANAYVHGEIDRWTKVIRENNVQIEQ